MLITLQLCLNMRFFCHVISELPLDDNELNLLADDIDAEIKRLSEETAEAERHLAVPLCHTLCESGSGHSLNDIELREKSPTAMYTVIVMV